MSARYDEAVGALADEQHLVAVVQLDGAEVPPVVAAAHALQRAQALALLALAEEVEALVEVLRDRLAPVQTFAAESVGGPCAHTLGTQCLGCDHATHHGSACLARVIAASGGEETCRCRFDEETATQAPIEQCLHAPRRSALRCTLPYGHPAAVLHADDHGNAWT